MTFFVAIFSDDLFKKWLMRYLPSPCFCRTHLINSQQSIKCSSLREQEVKKNLIRFCQFPHNDKRFCFLYSNLDCYGYTNFCCKKSLLPFVNTFGSLKSWGSSRSILSDYWWFRDHERPIFQEKLLNWWHVTGSPIKYFNEYNKGSTKKMFFF